MMKGIRNKPGTDKTIFRFLIVLGVLSMIAIQMMKPYQSKRIKLTPIANSVPEQRNNFLDNGVYTSTEYPSQFVDVPRVGSWTGTDITTGEYSSEIYQSEGKISVLVAGYPQLQGNRISIEILGTDSRSIDCKIGNPGEKWTEWTIDLGGVLTEFKIVAVDGEKGPGGWVGVSAPLTQENWIKSFNRFYNILSVFSANIYLLVFLLPGLLVAVWFHSKGYIKKEWTLLSGWILSGVISWMVWWVYFYSHETGRVISTVVCVTSLLCWTVFYGVKRVLPSSFNSFGNFRSLYLSLDIVMLSAVAYSCLMYMYLSETDLLWTVANRYRSMPVDNQLPYLMMSRLYNGDRLEPFMGDWLSSDRPPLLSAMLLLVKPLNVMDDQRFYQFVGTSINCMCFSGIIFLGKGLGLSEKGIKVSLITMLASGYFTLNTPYLPEFPDHITMNPPVAPPRVAA